MSSIKFNSCIDLLHGTSYIVQHRSLDMSTEYRNDSAEESDLGERTDLAEGNVSAERNEPAERNVPTKRKVSVKSNEPVERYTSHRLSHVVYGFDDFLEQREETDN